MNKILNLLLFVISFSCFAQELNQTALLEVADRVVMADEFVHVYNKNLDVLTDQENAEEFDDYLDLFVNFHLKLAEAFDQGVHQEESFQKEFNKYYKQLADNYIANGEVTDEMIKETYQRLLTEVRVSHLLISVSPNSTEEAWNEALEKATHLRERLEDEETSFVELAQKFSGDPSVKRNQGDMGWFKAFKMVHPFEDASYQLSIGEISQPVKTQFGYHLIQKTGERESIGKMKAAHIMLSADDPEQKKENEEQIFKIYEQLQSGDSFEDLAMHFSDDKNTAEKGGELNPFEVGEINSKTFEEKVFQLENPGDYTAPFETEFGWHIVKKLGNIPVESFESLKEGLRRKIKTSNRAQLLNERIQENIISYYHVEIDNDAVGFFADLLDERIYKANWKMDQPNIDLSKQLLKIDDSIFTYKDFSNYIENQQRGFTGKRPFATMVNELFDRFIYTNLVEYHKPKLPELDREFELKINEYKHGIMIFEIMEREIWEVAKSDSTALEAHYVKHKESYISSEMINGEVFTFDNKKAAKKFIKQVNKKGKTFEEVISSDSKIIRKSIENTPAESLSIPSHIELEKGLTPFFQKNNKYVVIQVDEVIATRQLELEEVKGQVISDYQNLIEEEWLKNLKEKFTIQINQETVELLKNKFEK